jgi:hypothetical protein
MANTRGTGRKQYSDEIRNKIKSSMILNRLMAHILEGAEMSSTQIRAAEILLKKTVPDLSATQITGGDGEESLPVQINMIVKDGSKS